MKKLSMPTLLRMGYLYDVLCRLERAGATKVNSELLGKHIGESGCVIRKDMHYLGHNGVSGVRYEVGELKQLLKEKLGYEKQRNACIIGLDTLGIALLETLKEPVCRTFNIVAGFDSNVNRLETIATKVELFPAFRIEEIIRKKSIEIACIATLPSQAQELADRCIDGGVSGILNFSSFALTSKKREISIRNIDIGSELNAVAALIFTKTF